MPEEIKTAPEAAPTAAPETKPLTGSALFESQMNNLSAVPAAKPEPKPESKPEAKTAPEKPVKGAKAEPKPAEKPAAAAKPEPTEKALDWKTAPAQFRTAHEKLLQVYEQTKKEKETEVGRLQGRLAELDRREVLTPEQKAEYQKKEQRLAQLESDLYSRDYRESPEFKDKYETPWKNKYGEALNEVKGLQVKWTENDEEKSRQATKTDFDRVLDAPTLVQARRLAKETFGEDADVVLQYRAELRQIEDSGNRAVEEKKTGFTQNRQQSYEKFQKEQSDYERARTQYDQSIVEKYKEYFAEDEANPEANAALKQGLDFVDSCIKGADQMPLEERAKTVSLMRRMAGAWHRDQVIIKQLRSQLQAKDEELGKYRKSAPGGEEDGGGKGEVVEKKPLGTSGLAAAFEKKLG